MFDLKIVGTKRVLYESTAWSVFCDGTDSEFEFMSFHKDTLGALREGDIVIDNKFKIAVRGGVVGFFGNKCLILAEEKVNPLFND